MPPFNITSIVNRILRCQTRHRPRKTNRLRPGMQHLEPRIAPSAVLLKDINPEADSSNPNTFQEIDGTLYFRATDSITPGITNWKSDGTSNGTVKIDTIPQTPAGVFAGGYYYYLFDDGIHGSELWRTDGTTGGTMLVKDITPGPNGTPFQGPLIRLGENIFFTANDGITGYEPWKSDGTSDGTTLLRDIRAGLGSSNSGGWFTTVSGTIFFSANDGLVGYELWKSDGGASGTVLVRDIRNGPSGGIPSYMANVNGVLFFRATDGVVSEELWKSDGTSDGTVLVKDIRPGNNTSTSSIRLMTNVNGTLFFRANDGTNGQELWKSDGTSTGTVLVKDIRPGGTYGNSPTNLTNVNGTLYFRANDGTSGYELWKSDGTSAGTLMVSDIRSNGSSNPSSLFNFSGRLIFVADDGVNGNELWTVENPNAAPTSLALDPSQIAENQPANTTIGTLSTTDPDSGETFTYTLVSGTGDADNGSFVIAGNTLRSNAVFDYETRNSYTIRVRTTDAGGLWFENQFTISVTNGNDAPTQVSLSSVVSTLLANTSTANPIRLADVSVTDDGEGTNTLGLLGADAGVFEIVNNQLRLKAGTLLNYTTQRSYSVTVTVDDSTVGGTPDASVNYTLSLQGLDGTTVQNGAAGRSFVRYVSLNFGNTLALADAVASVATAAPRIRLFFAGTTGTQAIARSLTGLVSILGNQVRIDFGSKGVGGDPNSSLGDGVYRIRVDLDGDGQAEITASFFRLFGDVDGNGVVNDTDIQLVTTAQGLTGLNLSTDLNGDGFVNSFDLTNVKRRKGARVVWP
jgi:ELWxxDGT repeat protein